MATFNVSKSGVSDAISELSQLETWVRECKDRCADVNTTFWAVMMGSWADASVSAAVQLQTNLLIYADALERLHTNYDNMLDEINGQLTNSRDNLLEAVKGPAGDSDILHFEAMDSVTSGCSSAKSAVSSLRTQLDAAQSALSGLENSGSISSALEALSSALDTEDTDIDKIKSTYDTYKTWVGNFEQSYSKSLSNENFIKDYMIDNAATAMSDQFEACGGSKFFKGADDFKSNILSKTKKAVEWVAKPLAEVKPENMVMLWATFKSVAAHDGYFTKGNLVGSLTTFLMNRKVEGNIITRNIGSGGGFFSKWWDDVTGFLRPSKWKEQVDNVRSALHPTKNGDAALKYFDDAAEHVDEIGDGVSRLGKGAKSAMKGLGYVGDFIELGTGLANMSEVYQTTQGDGAQKAAAAAVTGMGAVAKFGIGKAAGAAIGTVFGGPVGALVGMGVGMLIDWGVDEIGKSLNNSGFTQGLTDGIAWLLRGGKENESAFQAG